VRTLPLGIFETYTYDVVGNLADEDGLQRQEDDLQLRHLESFAHRLVAQ